MSDNYEERLIAARGGDIDSMGWLMEVERPWLLSRVSKMHSASARGTQAEDLVQECGLRLVTSHATLRFEKRARFRSWLLTVARNLMLNNLRRHEHTELDATGNSEPIYKPAAPNAHGEGIHALRKQIPVRQDTAIMLRDYCGCSFELIAQVLGCPNASSAQSLRARGMKSLQDLAAQGGGTRL